MELVRFMLVAKLDPQKKWEIVWFDTHGFDDTVVHKCNTVDYKSAFAIMEYLKKLLSNGNWQIVKSLYNMGGITIEYSYVGDPIFTPKPIGQNDEN